MTTPQIPDDPDPWVTFDGRLVVTEVRIVEVPTRPEEGTCPRCGGECIRYGERFEGFCGPCREAAA